MQIFGLSAEAWRASQEGETGRDKTSWEQDPVLAPREKPWTYGKGTMGNEANKVGNPRGPAPPTWPPDLSAQKGETNQRRPSSEAFTFLLLSNLDSQAEWTRFSC